jgi:hypothetical protein
MTTGVSTHRGESARNSSRANTRNSAPLEKLLEDSDSPNFSVFYQYCRNYQCRNIEAIIATRTQHNEVHNEEFQAMIRLSEDLQCELIIIEHDYKDELHQADVILHSWTHDNHHYSVQNLSWGKAMQYLQSLHVAHESNSTQPKCGPGHYDNTWLKRDTRRGAGTLDLSLSNALRCIPGVRHLDIDAAIFCPECRMTEIIIEASSDGMKGTSLQDKDKSTSLSRHIAQRTQSHVLLLQHHVNDDTHQYPIMLTGWMPGSYDKPFNSIETDWQKAFATVKSIRERHAKTHFTATQI